MRVDATFPLTLAASSHSEIYILFNFFGEQNRSYLEGDWSITILRG